jgi:diguanylate cyclase (GGDEF)-like protein
MSEKTIRLLIVDDDDDDLYLINDALSEVTETRYEVTSVNSALAAMPMLSANTYDVIISDYRLGYVTGIDFIRNVRLAGIDTPIILLTGLPGHLVDKAALEAGASDFLPKASLAGTVIDRSVRYAMAHADRQRLLNAVLKTTISGMAVLDATGVLTLWNPRFVEFAEAAFAGDPDYLRKLVDLALANSERDIEIGSKTAEVHCLALPDGGQVLALHDVTARVTELREREDSENQIRQIAMHDTLTGMPNRIAFNARLDESLQEAGASDSRLAIVSFDFNRFKEVNDLFGHAAGDEMLRAVAHRLPPILHDGDFAARLGGDEFVLIHKVTSEQSAIELSRELARALSLPIEFHNHAIEAGVSVGIAYFPDHGRHREELLANADLAMYRAKSGIGTPYCVFDAPMDAFIRERRKIAHELRNAIPNKEFKVYCQPQLKANGTELVGFEALLRWESGSRGLVPPQDFISVAEETGIIREIDEWMMRAACLAAAKWPMPVKIAVNMSARAICSANIVETVRNILIETGLAPHRLEVEVTETALINDFNRALHNLRQLKAAGVSIAMDDFGTGYSSLSFLHAFPFDKLKIDRSFIQSVGQSERAVSIFKAVAGLGKALDVPVLIEGIETEEQMMFAQTLGCEEVQGFYYGRPVAEAEACRMLAALAMGKPLPKVERAIHETWDLSLKRLAHAAA